MFIVFFKDNVLLRRVLHFNTACSAFSSVLKNSLSLFISAYNELWEKVKINSEIAEKLLLHVCVYRCFKKGRNQNKSKMQQLIMHLCILSFNIVLQFYLLYIINLLFFFCPLQSFYVTCNVTYKSSKLLCFDSLPYSCT